MREKRREWGGRGRADGEKGRGGRRDNGNITGACCDAECFLTESVLRKCHGDRIAAAVLPCTSRHSVSDTLKNLSDLYRRQGKTDTAQVLAQFAVSSKKVSQRTPALCTHTEDMSS